MKWDAFKTLDHGGEEKFCRNAAMHYTQLVSIRVGLCGEEYWIKSLILQRTVGICHAIGVF